MKVSLLCVGVLLCSGIISFPNAGQADGGVHQTATPGHQQPGKNAKKGGHMGHMDDVRQNLQNALGERYLTPVPAASAEQLQVGKAVFGDFCSYCHGDGGKGDGPAAAGFKNKPSDFTSADHSNYYSDQGRIHIISNGIPGTRMPAWKGELSEGEIVSVHAYIRSLRIPSGKD